ncbi:MAG TPA: hypothetical protein VMT00_05360 [Thermoanaerobaculia bacterium]|nr:hypothetical protein [Thermoanaerobaculia bacterium]
MIRMLVLTATLCVIPCTAVTAEEPSRVPQAEQLEKPEQPEPPKPLEAPEPDPPEPLEAQAPGKVPEPQPEPPTEEPVPLEAAPPSLIRAADPCEVRKIGREPRIDQFRREVFETVCESARWFDGFFGSRRFDEEARQTHGRLGVQLLWDEDSGLELDGRLKVQVDFPNLDRRLNAFLGRDDEEAFLTGSEERLDFLPTFFEREGGQEWLVGLGYRPVGTGRSSLDLDAGVEVETPLDPFVRTRYRHTWLMGNDNLLRARQTVYWTNQRGVGTSTRLDYERPVGSRTLARLAGNVVFDDQTLGADWDSGITVFHGFSDDRAIAWFVGIDGETRRDVPIEDYGTRITYRQRMFREWFFGELITGVTWPRDDRLEKREPAWHVGFGVEISFSRDER